MAEGFKLCAVLVSALVALGSCRRDQVDVQPEEGGYYRREHSLVQPYQGAGMDVPYWEFTGSTVVTSNYVRLTPDRQSKSGSLWNTVPVRMHNWEVLLHFEVHGQGKHLFGDGFAFWYTKERSDPGPVFGSRDYFTGLGVFFDTYSNHNGEHEHEHPYISAAISNGSLHYDHDRDGTHSQVAGCTCKFRNSKYDSYVAISYINRQLVVLTNIIGEPQWNSCFMVNDVDLPTGFYFGVSAITGELADNHDVISVKVYDVDTLQEEEDGTVAQEMDWSTVMPQAKYVEAPREHVEDIPPWFGPATYKAVSIGMIIVLLLGVMVFIGGLAFVKNQKKSQKRFF